MGAPEQISNPKHPVAARVSNDFLIGTTLLIGFWPVWQWYCMRTLDRSEEPWGLCALATALLFLAMPGLLSLPGQESITGRQLATDAQTPSQPSASKENQTVEVQPETNQRLTENEPPGARLYTLSGVIALCLYTSTVWIAPPLFLAVLAILCIWFLLVSRLRASGGLLGLLILSLPIIPSLNFFAGYPLRLLVTSAVCLLLKVLGFAASQEATLLHIGDHMVAVDAPCSGINMLWAEGYIAMLSACVFKLNWRNTALLSMAGFVLILVANTIRAATLSIASELNWSRLLHTTTDYHDIIHVGVGLITFFATSVATFWIAGRLGDRQETTARVGQPHITANRLQHQLRCNQPPAYKVVVMILAGIAAILPLIPHRETAHLHMQSDIAVQWPNKINGRVLTPVQAPAREELMFAAQFPGTMKRFSDGERSYFIRLVNHETRQLHPSSDCFRGSGFNVEPGSLVVLEDGTRWSCFNATKSNIKLKVMERIYNNKQSWTDVSQWYWSAVFKQTTGPWWAVTIAERRSL